MLLQELDPSLGLFVNITKREVLSCNSNMKQSEKLNVVLLEIPITYWRHSVLFNLHLPTSLQMQNLLLARLEEVGTISFYFVYVKDFVSLRT